MFDEEKDKWYHSEMDRLANEFEVLSSENLSHEEFMKNLDKRMDILNQISKLDSEHKQFLLDQLDKAGLDALQKIINQIFGVRA